MSSHLNSGYWARLSVTSDSSDSLAALCYELIRFVCVGGGGGGGALFWKFGNGGLPFLGT